jgi:DNA-binding transcriptional ArsR family regulator
MARLATTHDIFNAIAEPARRDLLSLLARGEQAVTAIVTAVQLAQPSVSKHLRVLTEVGLVRVRRIGRQRLYSVNADALIPMHQWVSQFEALWDKQLLSIKTAAEAEARRQSIHHPSTTSPKDPT